MLGAIVPRVGLTFGLGMAAVYGLLRLFSPPGFGAEAAFLALAALAVAAGAWLARRDGHGVLAFLHAVVLGSAAVLGLDFALDAMHAKALRGFRLPVAVALLPLAVVAVDWLLGFLIRRRGVRLTLEVAAAAWRWPCWEARSPRRRSSIVSSQRCLRRRGRRTSS